MATFRQAVFSPEVIDLIKRRRSGRKFGTPGHSGTRKTKKAEVAEKAAAAIKAGDCKSVENAIEQFTEDYLEHPGELTKDQRRHFKDKIKSFL